MKRFEVIGGFANFAGGILYLTVDQARSRIHALEDMGDGFFEILSPVTFKRGELVGYDGDVNKVLLQEIAEIPEPEYIDEVEPQADALPVRVKGKPGRKPKAR